MKNAAESKNKLIQTLMSEFRNFGYDGLSLSQISKATDLGKASLYHYFPGGKDQMALEVMQMTSDWVQAEIVETLISDVSPNERLKKVLGKFNAFYECGEKACILEAMIASDAPDTVKEKARIVFDMLIESFKKLALDTHRNKSEALSLAESTIAELQGALIVSRGTQNKSIFKRALTRIEQNFFGTKD